MSEPGHNSAATRDELAAFVQRIERLKDEKKNAVAEYNDAIKDVYAEAKGRGYDKTAMNEAMRMRAKSNEQRQVVSFYFDVLDIFS